jgi:hypothetical protein
VSPDVEPSSPGPINRATGRIPIAPHYAHHACSEPPRWASAVVRDGYLPGISTRGDDGTRTHNPHLANTASRLSGRKPRDHAGSGYSTLVAATLQTVSVGKRATATSSCRPTTVRRACNRLVARRTVVLLHRAGDRERCVPDDRGVSSPPHHGSPPASSQATIGSEGLTRPMTLRCQPLGRCGHPLPSPTASRAQRPALVSRPSAQRDWALGADNEPGSSAAQPLTTTDACRGLTYELIRRLQLQGIRLGRRGRVAGSALGNTLQRAGGGGDVGCEDHCDRRAHRPAPMSND